MTCTITCEWQGRSRSLQTLSRSCYSLTSPVDLSSKWRLERDPFFLRDPDAMPVITPKLEVKKPAPRSPISTNEELMMICGWGKCVRRLERVLQKGPNVNFKGKDGFTPLHLAAGCASPTFTKRLLESNADPNVPATELNATPLDIVSDTIAFEEARDDRLNDFDQVNRLDDTALAVRPDLRPHREVRKILEEAGAVFGKDW